MVVIKRFGEPLYPTLVPVDRITRSPGKPYHTIINAENFHALQLLLYCYEGQVDVIYIDPPYNTGAHDWKYNNSFVDASDGYRHSKWLAMMKRRLILARRLLKPLSGVLVVTIDEHEVHHLGMLLETLFPDAYRQMVTIVVNPKGVTQGRFSRVEEYALFAFGQRANVFGRGDDLLTAEDDEEKDSFVPRWKGLLRSGTNARRRDRQRLFYPVLVDPKRGAVLGAGEPLPLTEEPNLDQRINGYAAAWPVRTDGSFGNWSVGPTTLRQLIAQGYVALGGYDRKRNTYGISYLSKKLQNQISTGAITIKNYDPERNVVEVFYEGIPERQLKAVWHRTKHDAGAYGSDLLRSILGESGSFPFPKSLYAVSDTLSSIVLENKNALILDFFAGSGTTLHATCLLNAADGGNRKSVLVTNNEVDEKIEKQLNGKGYWPGDPEFERHGISNSVTWPRCKYVINGKRDDGTILLGAYLNGRKVSEGFEENAEFLKLDFLDPNEIAYGEKLEAIIPILWMIAGSGGELKSKRESIRTERWLLPQDSPYAVLIQEDHFAEFKRALKERRDITHVFLVTDSEEAYHEMIAELPGSPKTKMLYKSYLENFRINTGRNL